MLEGLCFTDGMSNQQSSLLAVQHDGMVGAVNLTGSRITSDRSPVRPVGGLLIVLIRWEELLLMEVFTLVTCALAAAASLWVPDIVTILNACQFGDKIFLSTLIRVSLNYANCTSLALSCPAVPLLVLWLGLLYSLS